MLRYIIFAPLVGAAICYFVGRRVKSEAFIGTVACASIGVSTIIAFMLAFFGDAAVLRGDEPRVAFDHLWTWMQVGGFRADFGFAMDRLSAIYVCFITFVGLLIHVFATGYMHGDKGFYRFFAYMNLFMFMMLVLVLGDNLLLMFVGWEGVGLCSYLLIGYYVDRKEAGDAAKKAFVANRIGDWGVILGIMLVFFITSSQGQPSISFFDKSSIQLPEVTSALTTIGNMTPEVFHWRTIFAGGITSIAILLFIGATGKSAQIPLFVWLPDAMAGPTPVSALIHAATMVTAGVYMIVRCSEIYVHAPTAMFIVAVVGALTALFAATIGLAQNDIKKVLAYSTISQIGYMMLACGVGAFIAAIFHVMTHAFFKALLFLGSGSVIHGMHHEQDMRRMGGLRKYMPVTFLTMASGWLAICGIPIFAGFFSKDEILWKTFSSKSIPHSWAQFLWALGITTAALTAIYMTRMMWMTFFGAERFAEAHAGGQADEAHAHAYDEDLKPHDAQIASAGDRPHHAPAEHVGEDQHAHASPGQDTHSAHAAHDDFDTHLFDDDQEEAHEHHGLAAGEKPHESPLVMTVPLVILAVLSTLGGLVGIPYALSSVVGLNVPNYFERALEPVVAHAPEMPGSSTNATHAASGTRDAHGAATTGAQTASEAAPTEVGEGTGAQHAGKTATSKTHGTEAAHSPEEVSKERWFSLLSVIVAAIGIGIGWAIFGKRPLLRLPRLLENKYKIDEIYNWLLINPIKNGSRAVLWKIFDAGLIDGIVNGVGRATSGVGSIARRLQPGFVRSYAAIILFGALLVIGYFAYAALAR